MKPILAMLCLAACGGAAPSTGTTPTGSTEGDLGTLSLTNHSAYDINSIQLSPFDHTEWGPNLLAANDPLMHGDSAKLAVFECKKYDLRLIDHEGDECVIQDIDLCFEDKEWTLNDTVLAVCQTGFSAH